MKKFLAVTLASLIAATTFTFVGCGKKNDDNSGGDNSGTSGTFNKPAMPTDKNMESVEQEDIYDEAYVYYNQIVANGYGQFQTYGKRDENSSGRYDNYPQMDGGEIIGSVAVDFAMRKFHEGADVYGGIKNGNSMVAAYTYELNGIDKSGVVSTDPTLTYANRNDEYARKTTGIQKDSSIYTFSAIEGESTGEKYKHDRSLRTYEENDYSLNGGKYIDCLRGPEYIGGSMYWSALDSFRKVKDYLNYKDDKLILDFSDYEFIETIARFYDVKVKSFSFSAKKNDEKFYASLKYSYKCTEKEGDTIITVESENIVLLDLSAPKSVSNLPSDGIDINNLSLQTAAKDMLYPVITPEQLTQAINEGKELTVDIAGNGNINNLQLHPEGLISVVDGKAKIDGAAIKTHLIELKMALEGYGREIPLELLSGYASVGFTYSDDDAAPFRGNVYANLRDLDI